MTRTLRGSIRCHIKIPDVEKRALSGLSAKNGSSPGMGGHLDPSFSWGRYDVENDW